MKWIFLFGLLLMTPAMVVMLRGNPRSLPLAGFAIGILPFLLDRFNLIASPVAWPMWPGPVKGIDVSLIDAIVIAVIVATPPVRIPPALKLAFGFYLFAVLFSTLLAESRAPSVFYVWQLLRAALTCIAVARGCNASLQFGVATVTGAIAGLAIQAVVALSEYAGGTPQAGAWFGHQNLLGTVSHFVTYPALALLLAGYYRKIALVGVFAGFIVAFAGGSRATIGLFAGGLLLTSILSAWHLMTGRKSAIAGAGLALLLVAAPFLYSAVERRSDAVRAESNNTRANMLEAASMILADHPFGVGANRYVIVANIGGYSERAGVPWNESTRRTPVHNTYYLVAAETGWLGLFALVSLMLAVIFTGFRTIRIKRGSLPSELSVGLLAAFMVLAVHMYYEWLTMTFAVQYLMAVNVGLMIGLDRILRREAKRRSAPSALPGVDASSVPETANSPGSV